MYYLRNKMVHLRKFQNRRVVVLSLAAAMVATGGYAGDLADVRGPASATATIHTIGSKSEAASQTSIRPDFRAASNPELRKLAEYERVLGPQAVSGMLIFTEMPSDALSADNSAADLAAQLQEFAQYKIQPTVILEPTSKGKPIDAKAYRTGSYDAILSRFFSQLHVNGVSNSMMGTWVYFPEANIPEFGVPDPTDFAANVTRCVRIQKRAFPNSRASILLDSETYPAGSADWSNGAYISLLPYVSGIPAGLLDSFGFQGFPWVPPANDPTGGGITDPRIFLHVSDVVAAARQIGVSQAWLNTGTFGRMYANDSKRSVSMRSLQRGVILEGILKQAQSLQQAKLNVAINVFAQDKSASNEATDWSYWQSGQEPSAPSTTIFATFAHQVRANGIALWVFDSVD